MTLKIFTDGGSKGNPGPSAIGFVIYLDNQIFGKFREDIGISTNNIAEYTALIKALEKAKEIVKENKISKIEVNADSQLLIYQLTGKYKIKTPHIQGLFTKIKSLEFEINIPIFYKHIPREENTIADALVNNKL